MTIAHLVRYEKALPLELEVVPQRQFAGARQGLVYEARLRGGGGRRGRKDVVFFFFFFFFKDGSVPTESPRTAEDTP